MGQRGAEQRHDPVAHHLIHRTLVSVDGLHHSLEYRVEQLAGLLGVAVGKQFEGTLHVREEHGDLLALTLEGVAGTEDLVGQIGRGVALRGHGSRRGDRRSRDRLAALVTKPAARRVGVPTRGTDRLQTSAATAAELGARRVILPALGTAQAASSGAFLHLDDLVGHRPVGLAVHRGRCFLAGGVDQAEDLAGTLVVPVPDIVDAILTLYLEIFLVCTGCHLGGQSVYLVVHVEIERHRGCSFHMGSDTLAKAMLGGRMRTTARAQAPLTWLIWCLTVPKRFRPSSDGCGQYSSSRRRPTSYPP